MAGWNTPARNAAINKRPCDSLPNLNPYPRKHARAGILTGEHNDPGSWPSQSLSSEGAVLGSLVDDGG
jgi:hypothetical protein